MQRQLDSLRMQLEVKAPSPALILVTGASVDDGSGIVALNLAKCLSEADYHVGLVSRNRSVLSAVGTSIAAIHLSSKVDGRAWTRAAVNRLADELRMSYDFAVVDLAPLTQGDAAIQFAQAADAVLVSLKVGRRAGTDDQKLMEVLTQTEARVMGVVGTSQEAHVQRESGKSLAPASDNVGPRSKVSAKTVASVIYDGLKLG